ncbi:hypothetical protein B0H10DRAFT_2213945 [Mycena sp. CBHHK59/15]|nr:hypothetical protein B0H10DRAFT_2213945 [Mycena sp. CBHHK59/15]
MPPPGHLTASWEIAVVVSLLVLLFVILGTVIMHLQRRRRRSRAPQIADPEVGNKTPPPRDFSRDVSLPRKPPLAASSTQQSSKTSYESESNRPPRYYWDHR